ncbi:MAG: DUF6580 family putative transport protein [Patescibacteria group bacterium]|jgi:hypothetical protein
MKPWSSKSKINLLLIALTLVIFGVIMRLLPHAPNFVPIGAIAFWSGLYLPKKYSFPVLLLTLVLSDLIIGFYSLGIMASVYLGWMVMAYLGSTSNKKIFSIAGGAFIGSIIFFLVTNYAVWSFGSLYPKTILGLWGCYINALPFFRNSLSSDLFYTVLFVAVTEFSPAIAQAPAWLKRHVTSASPVMD